MAQMEELDQHMDAIIKSRITLNELKEKALKQQTSPSMGHTIDEMFDSGDQMIEMLNQLKEYGNYNEFMTWKAALDDIDRQLNIMLRKVLDEHNNVQVEMLNASSSCSNIKDENNTSQHKFVINGGFSQFESPNAENETQPDNKGALSEVFGSFTDAPTDDQTHEPTGSQNTQQLTVKKATKFAKSDRNYPMTKKPRGYCLIVDNYRFDSNTNLSFRYGSQADAHRFNFVFSELGFIVDHVENKTVDEMKIYFKKFAYKEELNSHDALVVIILSHGGKDGIFGRDGSIVNVYTLLAIFNNSQCPQLLNKPKMFFISACRGIKHDHGVAADDPIPLHQALQPKWGDMIVCYSTVTEHESLRTVKGTWFGMVLAEMLMEHACQMDLEGILKEVAIKLSKEIGYNKDVVDFNKCRLPLMQTPSTEQIGWKKYLYFNPGLYE